jgi:hypothetical protein
MRYFADPRLFPAILLALFALAAIRYAIARDWNQTIYWGAAFALNFAVINMEKT